MVENACKVGIFALFGIGRLAFLVPVLSLLGKIVRAVVEIKVCIESVRRKFYVRYFLAQFQYRSDLFRVRFGKVLVARKFIEKGDPVPFGRILRSLFHDPLCYGFDARIVFPPRFFRTFQLLAVFLVKFRVNIPLVAADRFDFFTRKQRFFELFAMRADIALVLFKRTEIKGILTVFRVLRPLLHHTFGKTLVVCRVFRCKQAFPFDDVADLLRKLFPRKIDAKFGVADTIVLCHPNAVFIVTRMVLARRFRRCTVLVAQKYGKFHDLGRLRILVQDPLLAGGRLLHDDLFDQLAFLPFLLRTEFLSPVLFGAVFDILCLFLFGEIVIVVDEVGDPKGYILPLQKHFELTVCTVMRNTDTLAVVPFVVAVRTPMPADAVFVLYKVRERFGRRVFVVLVKDTVFPVFKAAAVLQRPFDELLTFRLRLDQVEHGHLRLLFALSVLYPLFILLRRGSRFGFFLFGFVLKIGSVVREIVLFRFLLFRLFVVKGVRLVVDLYKNGLSDGRSLFDFLPEKRGKFFRLFAVRGFFLFSLSESFRVG